MFRYFGTKASTSGYIAQIVNQLIKTGSIADAFGGLGTIGAELKYHGHQVTTCDVLTFPHLFQVARVECNEIPSFQKLKASENFENEESILIYLNKQKAPKSWIVSEYSLKRKFFTEENAIKLAGIWNTIHKWDELELISYREKAFLIASLLNSMDNVANTAGTYYAYLKQFNRKSIRPLVFEWLEIKHGEHIGKAMLGDALSQLKGLSFDVLYLDPPYNRRNYANYYHLPETLAGLTRKKIKSSSLSGIPEDSHPSAPYIREAMSMTYIKKIIESVNWNYLILHYCDNALIPLDIIRSNLEASGTLKEYIIPALGYTTKKHSRNTTHNVFVVSRT